MIVSQAISLNIRAEPHKFFYRLLIFCKICGNVLGYLLSYLPVKPLAMLSNYITQLHYDIDMAV